MSFFASGDGNTPLTHEEQSELIPELATREELNEWELQNIASARTWALGARTLQRENPLTEAYVRALHARMFDQTWRWAGRYRVTEKNIGIAHFQIRDALAVLLGDAGFWIENKTYAPDEIAVRLHHRMVLIHPFPNGNGRHARLLADVLARGAGRQTFSWGGRVPGQPGEVRRMYLAALRLADQGDLEALLTFARR